MTEEKMMQDRVHDVQGFLETKINRIQGSLVPHQIVVRVFGGDRVGEKMSAVCDGDTNTMNQFGQTKGIQGPVLVQLNVVFVETVVLTDKIKVTVGPGTQREIRGISEGTASAFEM